MLSIIILTYNEEDVIGECLASLGDFGDEVIVIDSFSTDKTQEIAKRHKAKVVEHRLLDFFSQRNFALDTTRGDFVYYIDADEVVTEDFKKEVKAAILNYPNTPFIGGWFIRRETYYFGKRWGLTDQVQRLFYKKKLLRWEGVVHETPRIEGEFGIINSPIKHFTHRNFSQMVEKTNKWSNYEAELRFRAHHPKMSFWRFVRVMMTGFFRSYIMEKGWRNGTAGFMESVYQAFSMFITYAKLWELQNKK